MANKYTYKHTSLDDFISNVSINLDSSNSIDTIDLSGIDTSTMFSSTYNPQYSTVTVGGSGGGGVYGATGSSWNTYSIGAGANGTGGGIWGSTQSTVDISTNGINVKEGGDIKVGGRSLSEFMDRVEARLGILQPKPELLEKYEALKQAYEHYKTLEALCMGDIPKRPDGK